MRNIYIYIYNNQTISSLLSSLDIQYETYSHTFNPNDTNDPDQTLRISTTGQYTTVIVKLDILLREIPELQTLFTEG